MSVRRRTYKDPSTGGSRDVWMVDVVFEMPSGGCRRIRKVSPVQTRRGAEAFERELRRSLMDGSYKKDKATPRFGEFAEEFMRVHAAVNNKPSTIKGNECMLRLYLVPEFGSVGLDKITTQRVDQFKARQVKAGLNPNTINKQLTLLRTILATAQDWGLIKTIPKIKKLKTSTPKYDFLSFEEAERLVDAAKSEPMWHSMLVVALNTGLRLGELLALEWDDVDLVARNMTVRQSNWQGTVAMPKGGRADTVPINSAVVAVLNGQRHLKGPLVWCKEDGSTLDKDNLAAALKRIRKRAGLRHIGWHCLRHTFASHLVMRNVPLKAVQELMRHQSIEMTMRYSHLSPGTLVAAVEALVEEEVQPNGTMTARGRKGE